MSGITAVSHNTNNTLNSGKRRAVVSRADPHALAERCTEHNTASVSCCGKELQQRMEQEAAKGVRQRLALYGWEQEEEIKDSWKAGCRNEEECPAASGEPAGGSVRDVKEESKSETEILVKPDGTRILVTKLKIGGMVTTMSLKISEPTDFPNDAKWTKGTEAEDKAAAEDQMPSRENEQAVTEIVMQSLTENSV